MADTERPPKRPRVSDEGQPECSQALSKPSGIKRNEECWMDDGNIVLIAGETAFKVDREYLSAESTVFEHMLSSTPTGDEVFDGLPVVRLPDNPTDLAVFFGMILPLPKQRSKYHHTPSFAFEQLFAIATLAHKYQTGDIEQQTIETLQLCFPSTHQIFYHGEGPPMDISPAQAIGVIYLARLINTPSLLPVAFCRCLELGGSVVEGWTRKDKSVVHLSQEDLIRVINGRNRLVRARAEQLAGIFFAPLSPDCECMHDCRSRQDDVFKVVLCEESGSLTVLASLRPFIAEKWPVYYTSPCVVCQGPVLEREADERRKLWMKLPGMFDIEVPGWAIA
ncbi:hypothetical protein C8Q74DRAFT_1373685 [Fomes fomentarius]|nr:hypothetical protein C8Q74DRAFT_1373685 [Fomes fomentarius]